MFCIYTSIIVNTCIRKKAKENDYRTGIAYINVTLFECS